MIKFTLTLEDFDLIKVEGDFVRDYFFPFVGGENGLIHDILDHSEVPHPNPYTDELIAIGGLLYRLECEGKPITIDKICKLIRAVFLCFERDGATKLCDENHTISKPSSLIKEGVICALSDYDSILITNVVDWISQGYNMAKDRFENGGIGVKALSNCIVYAVNKLKERNKITFVINEKKLHREE